MPRGRPAEHSASIPPASRPSHEHPPVRPAEHSASIPPALRPLYEHTREFVLDGDWSRVLAAGDIYKNGLFPEYTPDEDMALRLYHACASCPDANVAGLGQARYVELRIDPVAAEDRRGSPLPRGPGEMIAGEARERIASTPFAAFKTPTRQRIGALERAAPARGTNERAAPALPAEADAGRHHRSDSQNVHDHGVASWVRSAIKELVTRHGAPTPRGCMEAVRRARNDILESDEPEGTKLSALAVLDSLSATEHSMLGASAQEALALVFKEIDGRADAGYRANLAETLVKQLASGEERGMVVCMSGKLSRILGTFDGTGTFETEARPLWAVREEMGTLAARLRDKHGGRDDEAREEFVETCEREYVKRLGMSKQVLGPLIEEYAEAF